MEPPFKPTYIRAWRKERGVTLKVLGAMTGLDHGNLSRLERGIFPYSQPILEKIADALGTTPAFLISCAPHDLASFKGANSSEDAADIKDF